MKLFESLDSKLPDSPAPISLTIGNFDGLHLGHQAILNALTGTKVVITFINHPGEILKPEKEIQLLCSNEEKIALLKKMGIDFLYMIPFTKEFAAQSPREFLENLRQSIPFDRLVLGADARIGKDRAGTQDVVKTIAEEMDFNVFYVPDVEINGVRPSSSLIRSLIQDRQFEQAERLLGREIPSI